MKKGESHCASRAVKAVTMKKFLTLVLIFSTLLCHVACTAAPGDTPESSSDTPAESPAETPADTPLGGPISDYDDLLELYKSAVELFPSYFDKNYHKGEYAYSFEFTDERTKEIYDAIFASGYRFYRRHFSDEYMKDGRSSFGYALKDLNSDGKDELILMDDLFDLIAAFTVRDGEIALLFDNVDEEAEYVITDDGRICHGTETKLEENSWGYDVFYETLGESGHLETLAVYRCINYYANDKIYYRLTDGKDEPIDAAIVEEQTGGILIGLYSAGAYTKAEAGLDFIRLYGPLKVHMSTLYGWAWGPHNALASPVPEIDVNCGEEGGIDIYFLNGPIYSQAHAIVNNAPLDGDVVHIELENLRGRLEFCTSTIWLVIEESRISAIPEGIYCYDHYTVCKG